MKMKLILLINALLTLTNICLGQKAMQICGRVQTVNFQPILNVKVLFNDFGEETITHSEGKYCYSNNFQLGHEYDITYIKPGYKTIDKIDFILGSNPADVNQGIFETIIMEKAEGFWFLIKEKKTVTETILAEDVTLTVMNLPSAITDKNGFGVIYIDEEIIEFLKNTKIKIFISKPGYNTIEKEVLEYKKGGMWLENIVLEKKSGDEFLREKIDNHDNFIKLFKSQKNSISQMERYLNIYNDLENIKKQSQNYSFELIYELKQLLENYIIFYEECKVVVFQDEKIKLEIDNYRNEIDFYIDSLQKTKTENITDLYDLIFEKSLEMYKLKVLRNESKQSLESFKNQLVAILENENEILEKNRNKLTTILIKKFEVSIDRNSDKIDLIVSEINKY